MSKPLVLIVEDDAVAVETFQQMLRAEGFGTRVALDAETGFRAVEETLPAAIVVDLHLPAADGVAFIRRVRSVPRHADVPIAVITGDYLIDDRVVADLQVLGAAVFFKPLWADDLCALVGKLVSAGAAATRVC